MERNFQSQGNFLSQKPFDSLVIGILSGTKIDTMPRDRSLQTLQYSSSFYPDWIIIDHLIEAAKTQLKITSNQSLKRNPNDEFSIGTVAIYKKNFFTKNI